MVATNRKKRKEYRVDGRKQKDYAPKSGYRRQAHWEYMYGYGQVVKLYGRSAGDVWLYLRYACERWDKNNITISAGEIAETLDMGYSTVLRSLGVLRRGGLVEVEDIEPGRALTYIVNGQTELGVMAYGSD